MDPSDGFSFGLRGAVAEFGSHASSHGLEYGLASHLDSRTSIGQMLWYSILADEFIRIMPNILVVCFVRMVYISKPTHMAIDLCCVVAPQKLALTPLFFGGLISS